ncbi:MAG: NAD(P)/FAD-dependent oxidoreductase, partial [Acidobacteriota bacterium]
MKRILILGGGFAGVEVYSRLHRLLHPASQHEVSIELINQTNFFTFSPMLHEAATGSMAREHVVQPLREMIFCCGKDFHQAKVTAIDPERKIVTTNQSKHSYDMLVIALGVEQSFFNTPGAQEHALALKQLPGAVAIRNRIIHSFEQASEMYDRNNTEILQRFLHFVIVGGGATGTELAGQMSDLVSKEMKRFYGDVPHGLCTITLVHAGPRLLAQMSEKSSTIAARRLAELGVSLRLNTKVIAVSPQGVTLDSGQHLASSNVFWTAGTESKLGNILPADMLTERGLLKVTPMFQTENYPDIFGAGDCACATDESYRYPPTAQAAVQTAAVVARNVTARLYGKKEKGRRYRHKGDIVPIGNWYGIYERGSITSSGKLAWLVRRAVFLRTMYGWTNRLQVAFDWCIGFFLPRDTSE